MFEVFDPDGSGFIERADVAAWYRMVHETEYEDESIISGFPYITNENRISRSSFISHIRANRILIKPITTFQARVRQHCGGGHMWSGLTEFRKRQFFDIDESVSKRRRTSPLCFNIEIFVVIHVSEPHS
jgi:hypothetical protein